MTQDGPIFSGGFRKLYLAVKALAFYAGTFFLCYFWPQFLGYVVPGADSLPTSIFAAILAPLGFLVLGALQGKVVAVAHFVLLALACGATYLIGSPGAFEQQETLLGLWTAAMVVTYGLGTGFGIRRQLQKF